jgi:hypothetical protein
MKRFRIFFLAIFSVALTAAAFATESFAENDPPCVYTPQYYKSGFGYIPAGTEGIHYACIISPPVCTYYLPDPVLKPNDYHPCKSGHYLPIYG